MAVNKEHTLRTACKEAKSAVSDPHPIPRTQDTEALKWEWQICTLQKIMLEDARGGCFKGIRAKGQKRT